MLSSADKKTNCDSGRQGWRALRYAELMVGPVILEGRKTDQWLVKIKGPKPKAQVSLILTQADGSENRPSNCLPRSHFPRSQTMADGDFVLTMVHALVPITSPIRSSDSGSDSDLLLFDIFLIDFFFLFFICFHQSPFSVSASVFTGRRQGVRTQLVGFDIPARPAIYAMRDGIDCDVSIFKGWLLPERHDV